MAGGPKLADRLSEAQSIKFMRVIDAETGDVVQIELIDTGLTTVDGIKIYTKGVGASGGGLNVVVVSKTIGEIGGTHIGLDDMRNGGEYTGTIDITYTIEIDLAAGTDTFKWSKDGGATWEAEDVPITGALQTLDNGVQIIFNATTGHTLADNWVFTARAADPTSIQKNMEQVIAGSFIGAGNITSNTIDLRLVKAATITISGDWDAGAVLGLLIEIFTSPDGVNWDVEDWAGTGLEPTVSAGNSFQKTSNLDTVPKFMKIKVTNLDAVALGNLYARLVKLQE